MPNYCPEHYPPKENMHRTVLWHILLEIEPKWKKKSEIKPPLQTAAIRE